MPNFWTNATQMIYEKFKGPRTKDLEFEAKYEQIKAFEKNSNNLKYLFFNFQKNTLGKSKITFNNSSKFIKLRKFFKIWVFL